MNKIDDTEQPGPVSGAMESQSAEFLRRARECDSNLAVFAKLYAAVRTLAAALRSGRVSAALMEICSNLLGCEQVALVEIECETEALRILAEQGLSAEIREVLAESAPLLQRQLEVGNVVIATGASATVDELRERGITALVPLWRDSRLSAAVVLFRLLPQHDGLDDEDRAMLQLLANYAGPYLKSQSRG